MRFSVEEYSRYRAATLDPNLWPPRTLRQNGIAIGNADNATLQSGQPINITNPKSDPVFARSFSRAELGRLQTTKGLVLCFIADRTDPLITSNTSNLPTENLAVLPCTTIPDGTVTPCLVSRSARRLKNDPDHEGAPSRAARRSVLQHERQIAINRRQPTSQQTVP